MAQIEIFLYILVGIAAVILLPILFLTVCSLFVSRKKWYNRESRFYRALLNGSTAVILWLLRVKVTVDGREKLPTDSNYLFISNHRSNFDPIVQWYALRPERVSFVSKGENFRIPIFGRLIRRCCFMEIDRKNPRNAMQTVNRAAALLRETENCVGVYPEGTRSKSCVLLPFHSGVLKIAQKAEKPLVISAVSGTESISRNIWRFKRSVVTMTVIEVLDAQTVKGTKTAELCDHAASLMEQVLGVVEAAEKTTKEK